MNPRTIHRNQMWTDTSRAGSPAFIGRQCRPAPDYGQGEPRSGFVGAHRTSRWFDAPVHWPGRFANRLPGLFRCARFVPLSAAPRRGDVLSRRYPATLKFSRRLTESRAHQLRISRKPGSDRADPLHLEHPSYGFVAMPNHRTSGVVNVGIEVVGERNA